MHFFGSSTVLNDYENDTRLHFKIIFALTVRNTENIHIYSNFNIVLLVLHCNVSLLSTTALAF